MCPTTLLQMLAQPRRMSSIKFHSSTAKHVTLFIRHHARIEDHTPFFCINTSAAEKAACVNTPSWKPVALFQSEAAGITNHSRAATTHSARIVASNTIGNYLPQTLILAPNSKPKIDPKNEAMASPNETIEAVSQKLKLKMASVKRDTNCPKRKEMLRRPKKKLPVNVPTTLLQMLAQPRRMSSIKFHSSTAKHVTLFIRHHARIEDHTPFFCIMLTLRRYTHKSPGSQYFPKLELDSTSPPLPPRPMLIQT